MKELEKLGFAHGEYNLKDDRLMEESELYRSGWNMARELARIDVGYIDQESFQFIIKEVKEL